MDSPPGTVTDVSGRAGPGEKIVQILGVDHPVGRDAAEGGALAAVRLPVELSWRVRVGVDGEHASRLEGQPEQPFGRVEPVRPAVDLHRDAVLTARAEHAIGVELRFRPGPPACAPAAALHDPAGAVPEHVHPRVGDRRDHPPGHGVALHAQLRVDARHHHVELVEQAWFLVKRSVVEDVDLDPGEDAERRQPLVEFADDPKLPAQPLRIKSVRHGQPGRVVGQRDVAVADRPCGGRHLLDRAPAVRPVRVGVQVAAERAAQRGRRPGQIGAGRRLQPPQVDRHLAADRLGDDGSGHVADPGQARSGCRRARGRQARPRAVWRPPRPRGGTRAPGRWARSPVRAGRRSAAAPRRVPPDDPSPDRARRALGPRPRPPARSGGKSGRTGRRSPAQDPQREVPHLGKLTEAETEAQTVPWQASTAAGA